MANTVLGDRFEDRDPRQGNRVIKITGVTRGALGGLVRKGLGGPKWIYTVQVAEWNPFTVGRRGKISNRTLDKRYKKLSR